MKAVNVYAIGLSIALAGALSTLAGPGHSRWSWVNEAVAASSQHRDEARSDLDQVTALLKTVDTAYASGNSAEAQTRYDEARSNWSKVSQVISAREAREVQLLFDSLGKKLKSSAPASEVKSTVHGMLEELREDIARELR
jgi:hypothetical protein